MSEAWRVRGREAGNGNGGGEGTHGSSETSPVFLWRLYNERGLLIFLIIKSFVEATLWPLRRRVDGGLLVGSAGGAEIWRALGGA